MPQINIAEGQIQEHLEEASVAHVAHHIGEQESTVANKKRKISSLQKRKRQEEKADQVLDIALAELGKNPEGRYSSFGATVAKDLEAMNEKQAIIAKKFN